ncbi:hypothetical protein HDV63DRAFT_382004 [Trichoderma sp. SZMC 28014]
MLVHVMLLTASIFRPTSAETEVYEQRIQHHSDLFLAFSRSVQEKVALNTYSTPVMNACHINLCEMLALSI